ncbi:MAG TPA: cupin domain-containing protein [Pyrinomonadaceae bacterium]|nr:cupin domain-containing protein [Pyrinomonadaceae bacterium]
MPYKVEKWKRPYPPSPAKMRMELAAEGYEVFHWSDRPESFYARHKHPDDQCHWIISGSLEITVEPGGTFILQAGDRDLMPAGTFHTARVLGDEPVCYLVGTKECVSVQASGPDDFEMLLAFAEMAKASEASQDAGEDAAGPECEP